MGRVPSLVTLRLGCHCTGLTASFFLHTLFVLGWIFNANKEMGVPEERVERIERSTPASQALLTSPRYEKEGKQYVNACFMNQSDRRTHVSIVVVPLDEKGDQDPLEVLRSAVKDIDPDATSLLDVPTERPTNPNTPDSILPRYSYLLTRPVGDFLSKLKAEQPTWDHREKEVERPFSNWKEMAGLLLPVAGPGGKIFGDF